MPRAEWAAATEPKALSRESAVPYELGNSTGTEKPTTSKPTVLGRRTTHNKKEEVEHEYKENQKHSTL
jgi:hypothetical protein